MIELNLEYEEIYPRIFVYKNLLPHINKIYYVISESEKVNSGKAYFKEWSEWFTFGTYCSAKQHTEAIEDFYNFILSDELSSSQKEELRKQFSDQMTVYRDVSNSNQLALIHYSQKNNINLPDNSFIPELNIAKYYNDVDLGNNREDTLAMQFHTDYSLGEWYWPNNNFIVTCTTYINEDYDGGELLFVCGKDIIKYKPNAGDILVFPSGSPMYPDYPDRQPYFHAVNSVKNKPKYFIRNYIKYPHAAEDLWSRNEEKYGEDWPDIAKSRGNGQNILIVRTKDDKPFNPDSYHNEESFDFYGSNLISRFYDVPEELYQIYNNIYEFEEFE